MRSGEMRAKRGAQVALAAALLLVVPTGALAQEVGDAEGEAVGAGQEALAGELEQVTPAEEQGGEACLAEEDEEGSSTEASEPEDSDAPVGGIASDSGEVPSEAEVEVPAGVAEPGADEMLGEKESSAEGDNLPQSDDVAEQLEALPEEAADVPVQRAAQDDGATDAGSIATGPAAGDTATTATGTQSAGSRATTVTATAATAVTATEVKPTAAAPKPSTGWWCDPATGATYFYKGGKRQRGWVVTKLAVSSNKKGAKRRYWLDANFELAVGRVVNPKAKRDKLKGSYLAYATPKGYVVTGKYRTGKRIYVADTTGHLASLKKGKKRGWLASASFDAKGRERRYYLYRDASGGYYAKPGYSAAGYAHYTTSKGYVRTGVWRRSGKVYIASERGRLAALKQGKKRGWLVSDAFGQGTQRYYLYRETSGDNKGICHAIKGYSKDGYAHYTTAKGYVKRSDGVKVKGKWYLAGESGRLERSSKAQIAMVKAAWSTPPTGAGLCAAWVTNVGARAGSGRIDLDARDMYWRWGASADMSKIKPGAIVAVSTHSHTSAGSIWGHVGVYVGGGTVRDSVYGYVRTSKLSWWTSYYGTTVSPKWGWYAGRKL